MPRSYKSRKKTAVLPDKYEKGFLNKLDQRTQLYQLLTANRDAIVEDIGGIEQLSHIQKGLVDRYVFLEALTSKIEFDIANKPAKRDQLIGKWVQAVNSLTGLAKTIGVNKRKVSSMWSDHGQTLEEEEVA